MSQITNLGAANGGAGINTLTPDTGGAVTPVANNINIFGTHGINTSNAGNPTMNVSINNAITLGDLAVIGTGSNALSCTTGDINIASGNLKLPNTSAGLADGVILFGGNRFISNYGTQNTFVGQVSGNATVTGMQNTGVGTSALSALSSGEFNVAAGNGSLDNLTTGTYNTAVGQTALTELVTGSYNTAVGYNAGLNYTGAENSNILIGNKGVVGESNVIRIGNATGVGNENQNSCYIQGIYSQTVSNAKAVMIDSVTGQLGVGNGFTVTWTVVTGATQTIAVNNGYISNRAGLITYSLPATSAVGDVFEITNINTALGWTITQAAGQSIRLGNASTTVGVGGSLSSLALGDSIRCVCVVANTTWVTLSVVGNVTIV